MLAADIKPSIADVENCTFWESHFENPQESYDDLTSFEHGWEIVADEDGIRKDKMGCAAMEAFGIKGDPTLTTLKEVASEGELKYLLENNLIKEEHVTNTPDDYKFDGAHNFLFSDGLIVVVNPQVEPQAGFDGEFAEWENIESTEA